MVPVVVVAVVVVVVLMVSVVGAALDRVALVVQGLSGASVAHHVPVVAVADLAPVAAARLRRREGRRLAVSACWS